MLFVGGRLFHKGEKHGQQYADEGCGVVPVEVFALKHHRGEQGEDRE